MNDKARRQAREYIRNRYGRELTDTELDELIERETGGKVWESNSHIMPGGFEVMNPTWGVHR